MEKVNRNQFYKIYLYNKKGVILELRNYNKYFYKDFNIYDELITQQDNYFYSIYLNNEIKQKRKLNLVKFLKELIMVNMLLTTNFYVITKNLLRRKQVFV